MKPDCKTAGVLVPVINRNACEGKADCVEVCPYGVFAIGTLSSDDKRALSLLGRLKARVHGNQQAFVVKPAECHSCGACVPACPERAITLVSA